jgi:hypothetical protein
MPRLLRPLVVARYGISLVWRRRWLRMLIMFAWLPIVVPTVAIFMFEFSTTDPELRIAVGRILTGPMQQDSAILQKIVEDPASARHEVWSTLILFFFRYPQLVAMVVLVGLIAPTLVSYDLRSKAYLMYFSRPLTPTEYIVGKSGVVWFYLSMIVTLPALLLYVVGVLLSPDLSVVGHTWDIPLRILGASLVLVIPTTALALCYSSFTSESRYATFAWFATWVMGFVSYQILTFAQVRTSPPPGGGRGYRRRAERPPTWEEMGVDFDRWRWLSPYHILGKVESWVFGLDMTGGSVLFPLAILVLITVVGTWIVRRRIIARLSV